MRINRSMVNAMCLFGTLAFLSCSKGKSTVDKAKESANYKAKNAKNYENVIAGSTFPDNIEFFVTTDSAVPLPEIGSEFRAFDITALFGGGTSISPARVPAMLKSIQENWDTAFFTLDAEGNITTSLTCENGVTREACVGSLTGSSSKTDREGRAFTGYKTPDRPGAVIAVVLKVPDGSSAANLMQYSTIQVQSWTDWGKRGESPLEASLLLVPQLENDLGEPVVKAGAGFSVNLVVPGIPTTPKGEGYLFDIETTGVELLENDRVVIPSGRNVKCNFRNGVCSIPGGPFKVLFPTTMTITVKPSDPQFPVKVAKLEIPVITGKAKTIMLSTTFPATKITNLCTSGADFTRPCVELSADIDEVLVYPFLADEGGNFVGLTQTDWSATGPLATRLANSRVSLNQTIRPQTPGFGIIDVSTDSGMSAQFTYKVNSGIPAKVEFKTERAQGSISTERVGVPFRVISTLYDRKDNLCVDYNTSFGVKLELEPIYPVTPPQGITAASPVVSLIDQSTTKIQVTNGIGVSTQAFSVAKVPDLAAGQFFPSIRILDSTLNLTVVNSAPITILPGAITQTLLRNGPGGQGTAWDLVTAGATGTSFQANRMVAVQSDQQFFFNVAGYDAGGNYVTDVPSKFWGVSYPYHPTTAGTYNTLVSSLRDLNPSSYNALGTCPNPTPDAIPPSGLPTNQPQGNKVYCGIHRGLLAKQGFATTFQSPGLPGAGRVLAIPLDSSIKTSISPMLNVTSGAAKKFEIVLLDTNPAANPLVLANPIPAGKQFRIQVSATDDDGNTTTDFSGSKTLSFSGSSSPSWGLVSPVLPDGNLTCVFTSGVCVVPGPYMFARGTGVAGDSATQSLSTIAIEQVLAVGEAGVTGIQASFFRSIPGAATSILLTDKKGGPSAGALQLNPISSPEGIAMNADQEFGFAVAITDALGNFIRNASSADNIQFNGFEGTLNDLTGTPGNYFNLTTRVWATMSWPSQFTQNNLFTANLTPPAGFNPTSKKFYDPSVPGDVSSIATVALRDSAKYSFVFVPQNRVGKGFAVPYSVANASLRGWPSPLFDLEPGAPDFTEVKVFHDTDNTVNNSNITAGACNKFKVTLNDHKGNQAINYSTVTNITLKIFNVNASKPNGVDDPFVGASNLTATQYSTMNKPEIPGPVNSGFQTGTGSGGVDLSLEASAKTSGSYGPYYEYDVNYASYTSKAPRFADWWSLTSSINKGEITLPGEICLQEGQTLANRLSTPVSQKIVQVEIEPSTFLGKNYIGLISRGAGRTFSTSYGSTSPVSFNNDILTVKRGPAHHLHGAYVDDFQNPQLAWLGATLGFTQKSLLNGLEGDQLGVESPCPYPEAGLRGGCGSKTIYWHIHDSSCNYMGPATSVVQDGTLDQSKYSLTPAATGAQGSSAFTFTRNDKKTPTNSNNSDVPHSAYVTNGTLKGSWYAYYRPGKPDRVGAGILNGQVPKVDTLIRIGFSVRDQFNNAVLSNMSTVGWESASLARNPYGATKTRKMWSDIIPPNAPTGESPTRNGGAWGFNTYANAISFATGISDWIDSGNMTLYNASNPVTFNAEFVEQTPSVWCSVAGRCPTTSAQTFNGSFELAPLPGPAVGIELLSNNGANVLPLLAANFPTIFPSYPLVPDLEYTKGQVRSCLHDSFKNLFECNAPSTWSIVDSLDGSGNATSDHPIAMKLAGGVTPPVTQTGLEFYPSKSGSSKISVTRGSFTKVSDPISVNGGPLDHIEISSFGTADDPLAPITLSAGQELPIKLCLADATDKVITANVYNGSTLVTDPNLTYNVTFSAGIIPNREDKSVVLSTASGAGFDSNSFGPGTRALAFVSGCKDLYLKALASGTVSGSRLLTVTTSDPLRPAAQITATSGLSVSTINPGALNGFVTSPLFTSNTPTLDSVPAWSNVQTDAGYASASGNRFDLKIEARDAYGNNLNATTTVNLTRVRDDGVTAVSRPLICQNQTTTAVSSCLTVNFSNASEVIVSKLASDVPGKMFIMANNGTVGTRVSDSKAVNFQVTAGSIASYSLVSVPTTMEAGVSFTVSIGALDSAGSIMTGIDSVLSAKTFTAFDSAGANLSTHSSPNSTAPTLPTNFSFTSGIGTASFTLTKKENLSFRVRDADSIQSPLASISIYENFSSHRYQISCKLSADNSDCSGTSGAPYEIAASRTNLIDLTVTKTDAFGNKKNSPTPLYLKPIYLSGSSLSIPGKIHSTTAKSYVKFSDDNYISFSMPDENGVTLDKLYYGVGNQTASFDLPSKEALASIDKNVYIKFLPHIDTVYAYQLKDFGSSTFAAGSVKNFDVRSFDIGGNTVKGVDAALNAQTYTWSGGSGISPSSNANVIPTSALIFTDGRSQALSATFFLSKSYTFLITDNWSHSVKMDEEDFVTARSSNHTWYNTTHPERGAIVVEPNPPSSYAVAISTTQQAGVPFTLTLGARDLYGNLIVGWTDSLTFSYLSGASPSIVNPKNSSVFTAAKPSNTTNTEFTYGLYTPPGNPFTLYRSNLLMNGSFEVTQLRIQGNNTNTATPGTPLSTTVSITTTPDTDIAYSKITSDPVYSAATELSNLNLNYSTSSTYNYYNFLFDQFGNMKANPGTVTWTGTGALSGKMVPTSGPQTLVSPVASGSGKIKADCSAISGCISDETGTISLGSGPLDRFAITDTKNTTANLGEEIPVSICMADAVGIPITTSVTVNSVLVTDPNATIPLELRQINITDTPETQAIKFSKASGAGFDAAILDSITGTTNFTFANGCTTVYAKIFSKNSTFGAANLLRVRYDDPNQPLRGTISTSGLQVPDVAPLPLDHFVTSALNAKIVGNEDRAPAWSDIQTDAGYASGSGNRFDVKIEARDLYGNSLNVNTTANLTRVRVDGVTAVARPLICQNQTTTAVSSCLTVNFSNVSEMTVTKLASDVPGVMYIMASNGTKGTDVNNSKPLNFSLSEATVASYSITSSPTQTHAGVPFVLTLSALDAGGSVLRGIDTPLSAKVFSAFDSTDANLTTHLSPNFTAPTIPTSLSFTDGVGTGSFTFVNKENLSFRLRDASGIQSALRSIDVNASLAENRYQITCNLSGSATDCSGTSGAPFEIVASRANLIDLTVTKTDGFGNRKNYLPSLYLEPSRIAGTSSSTPYSIRSTTSKNYFNNGSKLLIMFSIPTESGVTLDNLFYGVANQTVTFDFPTKESGSTIDKNVFIKFLPHIDVVAAYELSGFGSDTFVAGTVKNFNVRARDYGVNVVTGVDSELNSQTYTWSGGSGISPWGSANVVPTSSLTFTNGTSQAVSATFYQAKSYTFLVSDNWSNPVQMTIETAVNPRNSGSPAWFVPFSGALVVNANPPSTYSVSVNATQQAGIPFNLTLAARDVYGNPSLGWTDSLTFSYLSGASDSILNPKNPSTVFTATKASDTTNTLFTFGTYTPSGNPFTLYRSNLLTNNNFEVTQLKIQGTNTNTASGTALSSTVNITTTPHADVAYAKITSASSYSAATELSGLNFTYSTASTYDYFNYLFDQYGNRKDPSGTVQWTGTGALSGKMAPTSGPQTLVSPVASGSGVITADCSTLSGCISDSTGTITLGSGPLGRFEITEPVNTVTDLGTEIPVSICMADDVGIPITNSVYVNSVLITNPNATIPLELRQINITDTPERQAIRISKGTGAQFDSNLLNTHTGTNDFTFVNGCTTVYAKIYSTNSSFGALNLLRLRYDDPNQTSRGTISSSGLQVPSVNALPLDHYVTRAMNTASGKSVEALSNVGTTNVLGDVGGNRFNLQVFARDLYGNPVLTSNTVALSMLRSNGVTALSRSLVCSAPTNDGSCLNPSFSNSSSITVNNLALDVAGSFYVKASTAAIGISSTFSDLINFKASPLTVKRYVLSHPAQVNAGDNTTIQVRAEDNSGGLVVGADSSLDALTYSFYNSVDTDPMSDHKAPDLTDPIVPTTLTFNGGLALPTVRFVKSETGLLLNVKDNLTVPNYSTNVATLNVNPGNSLYYDISCSRVIDSSDCTGSAGSPVAMTASAADKFNLEFRAYDLYKNPKLGDGAARAVVTRISGSAGTPGPLETVTGGYTYTSNQLDVNMATLAMVPKSAMFYRVGNQTIDISLSTAGALYYRKPNLILTPTIDTVRSLVIGTSASVVAGQSISTNLQARDSGWNTITGIDSELSARSYTWSGPSLSPSPSNSSPILPSGPLSFVNGVASGLSITYKRAEVANVLVIDNYSPCGGCSGVGGWGSGGKRNNSTGSAITVSHAPSASYSISGNLSPKAGVGFDVTVTALDEFSNPATSWASDTLTFAWSGANSSVANQVSAAMSPTLLTSGSRAFASAVFTTSGVPFTLYKVESPTLTITGTQTAGTKDTAALTGTRTFSVQPSDTAAYVKLSESSNPLNATLSGVSFSQQTDQTKVFFAHLYDPYTNIKSNNSAVAWSGSGVLAGKLSPATGSNTTFAPTAAGTGGVVTASCTAITAGCQPDSTGALTIDPSNVSKIVYISPSPTNNFTQLTTACQELRVQTQDLVNNPANVNADAVFTFTSTGGNGDFYNSSTECTTAQAGSSTLNTGTFHTTSLSGTPGSRNKTMATGTNVISVWFANRTAVPSNAAVIRVDALSRFAILNATITPDTARRVSYITTNPTLNAVGSSSGTTCLPVNYRINDIWGNQQSLTSASTINLSVTGADHGGTIHSDAGCTTGISSRSLSSGNQDTVYYKDTKANRSTFNVLSSSTLNGTTIQAASNIDINVLPGLFTLTETPTSGSYTKDAVTLLWAPSPGAKDYRVSYGATSACGINISTTAAGPSISFTTGLNGLYYICVVANSYTAGGVNLNATNHGVYNFYIDNLAPTGTITAPTLASIGPVTTEVGTGSITTFTGNAADSGGSLLSKVELEIREGANYWNGSAWTTTPSVVLATGTASWSYAIDDANFANGTTYSLRVQVTDNSSNVTTSAATRNFTWDTSAPTVNITAFGTLLSSSYYSNATSLNTALTTASGAITYRFYIVSGSSCSGGSYSANTNLATNITANPGVDGQYTLCVIGKDQAENEQATPTAFTWFKDTVAPTISGGVPNMGPVNAGFTPSLTSATDTSPPAGSVTTYLWTTTTNALNCTTAFGNTAVQNTSITSTCTSGFGTSTLRLRVSDTAGNITDYSPTFNWDTQPRTISSISSPSSSVSRKAGDIIDITVTFSSGANSANVVVAGGTPTLALNTTPAQSATYLSGSGSNVLTFRYTVQAGDNVATFNVNGASALILNGATIRDTVGTTGNNINLTTPTGTLNGRNITIDTTAPTLVFASLPASESNVTSLNVGIAATDTSTYTYALVQGTSAACPGTQSGSIARTTNITNSMTGYAEGDVTLCAQATDAAGNVQSGFTTYTWKKDTVAPANPTGVAPSVEVDTLTPTITWNAAAGDVTGLRVRVFSNTGLTTSVYDSGEISFSSTSRVVSPALPRDGRYFICVISRDFAGNWSTCSPTSFTAETDTVHLSWFESGNVQYAKKDKTSAWAVSTAATGFTYQGRTSLAVDSSGNPAISYGTTNGTDSSYRYSRWNGTAWTNHTLHTTSNNVTGGILGTLVAASTTPTFQAGFLAFDTNSSQLGVQTGITNGSNVLNSYQAYADNGLSFSDLAIFIDSNSIRYTMATPSLSGVIRPVITESSTFDVFTPTLPNNCAQMPYVSGVSRQSGSSFAMAGICVMADSSCQVWHGQSTYTSAPSWTAMTWTNLGTARTSGCTVGNLTVNHRPNIMMDKQIDRATVVFTDITNSKIVRSSFESGSWVNEDVKTSLTGNFGSAFVALDQYSRSYVSFLDNGILYMTNNNGREHPATTGGWNTPTVISNTAGISGFAGPAINGMKGRGNYTGGK